MLTEHQLTLDLRIPRFTVGDTLRGWSRNPLVIFITIPGMLVAGMMWNFQTVLPGSAAAWKEV